MTDLKPEEIVEGTADAAFVSDQDGLVLGWNQAASELLGYPETEVIGTPCHGILCGLDLFGNQYCGEHCAIRDMAARGEPTHRFVLDMRHASGDRVQVNVSVVRLRRARGAGFLLLHILTPLQGAALAEVEVDLGAISASEASGESPGPESGRIRSLTPREVQVLALLAAGNASQDIANELFISLTTVRTHVQNILRKLDVHSQLEAVAVAFGKGLI